MGTLLTDGGTPRTLRIIKKRLIMSEIIEKRDFLMITLEKLWLDTFICLELYTQKRNNDF